MQRVAQVTGTLASAALWLAGAGLVLMTAFVFAQVVARYLLGFSLFWAEPASVNLMGWFIFLGAAVGLREGYHLAFDVGLNALPPRGQRLLHSVSDVVVGAFGAGMAVYGWQLAAKAADTLIPGLGVSRAFDFAPLVAGGVLLVLFSAERLARRAAGLTTRRFGDLDDAADGRRDGQGTPGAAEALHEEPH